MSKYLARNVEKDITVEDNNKKIKMNIANFINIYTNIDTYIICDSKNGSR